MSFDTTASNSGNKAGACVLLEHKLNKPLLNLACRHHIHELIIAKVFETVIERASSCPQTKLLQRFPTTWNTVNAHVFESAISDDQLATELDPIKKDILDFLKKQLRTFQPRDGYKELLHLDIYFSLAHLMMSRCEACMHGEPTTEPDGWPNGYIISKHRYRS